MAKKYKRPTHESDALAIMMSEDVAPELLPLIQQLGDPLAAVIAFSQRRAPDFWKSLLIDIAYSKAMLNFFKRLHKEGRPLRREWLLRIKSFVSKFNDNVAARPSLYLLNVEAGVKAWSVEIPERTRELIVDVLDDRGRKVERFRIPIVG